MFSNYLKIAWRNLMKNKVFSFINIFGLSIGLTCCILITLYIFHESSYDKHHVNAGRIFQLGTSFIDQGVVESGGNTSAPLGRMLQQEFPEIEASTRILALFRDDKTLLQVEDKNGGRRSFYEQKGFLADSNFFQVLTYPFKEGKPETALNAPNTIVISEEISQKLFGKESALDKLIRIGSSTHGDTTFRVTGVLAKPKAPSHIDAGFFLSFRGGWANSFANSETVSLANNNMFNTYILLKKGADVKQLQEKFPGFIQRHLGSQLQQMGKQRAYFATPITDVYLSGGPSAKNAGKTGSRTRLFILGSIALLTLLIACINFMNLSTANSARRAAEVGVRKVLGAQKTSLLRQFLGEAMVMSFIALALASLLTLLLLPLFEQVSGKKLIIPLEDKVMLSGFFILMAFLTGLLAGSYPAFYLSSFRPIKVLKGRFTNSLAAISLRKGLVVFQFMISIVLIVASVVIANQMEFLKLRDLGFQKEQQVIIPLRTPTAKTGVQAFKNEVANETSVRSLGAANAYPGIRHPQDWLMYRQGQTMSHSKQVYINLVDDDFLQTIGVKLLAGRLFSEQFPADSLHSFVVNEEVVKQFGFASAQDAIGKWLAFESDGEQHQFSIIGVVKNFHFKDLHEVVEPFAFRMFNGAWFNYLVANSQGQDIHSSIASLEKAWKKLNPHEPFEYSFLDQDFQKNYETESRQASLISYFTIIAIIISCLGLFGLASFTAEQRTKEIGIRKVLGASVAGVVTLLSKDFLKLVLIAVVIASPLAWFAMNKWLQNFAYKTTITWQVFVITTLVTMLIAFATISFQAVKAAVSNPV
ncbi:MAG TPA: ABC transporter permease, partial [Flavisolibacter sp.]